MADDSQANVPSQEEAAANSAEVAAAVKSVTSWVVPVVTTVVLISVFCLYYFVYVAAQREYLANRNFRSLAVLGDQIQAMVSSYSSILEFTSDRAEKIKTGREDPDLKDFVAIRPEDKTKKPAEQEKETLKDYQRYLAPGLEVTKSRSKPGKTLPRLEERRRNGHWELVLRPHGHLGYRNDYVGSLELTGMLGPLVRSLPFDDIILVSKNGTIVYQSNTSGPQFTTLTALLQAQPENAETKSAGNKEPGDSGENAPETSGHVLDRNADKTWQTRSMHMTDVLLAGTRYKLFLQPVLVDAFVDEEDEAGPHESAQEWVLCGFRSAKALEWEALSISSTFMVWVTALFIAIFMSGPILKTLFLNHRQHLRLREIGFLGIVLVLLTSVFTFAGLNFLSADDTDEQLQRLGRRISKNIHDELQQMRQHLQYLCHTDEFQKDLGFVQAKNRKIIRKVDDPEHQLPEKSKSYPYFNNAFWTDDDGQQIIKWSTSRYVTPMIDISQQRLFKRPKTTYLDGGGPAFYFDSVKPANKIEYLAVLTMRTSDCNPDLSPDIQDDLRGGSAFLTAQPLSLIDPILPYGYGFALLDQNGLVLFHTDKTRNLHENFLQETDWSNQLHAAMFGHSNQRPLQLKYTGGDYMARVMPIDGISRAPWSLVVYRDLTAVRTLNVQAISIASALFLLILALPVITAVFWYRIRRPRFAPEWLWPNQARAMTYVYEILVLAALIILFLFLGFTGSSEQNVIACVTVPYTAFLLTALCIRAYAPGKEKVPARSARKHYSWLVVTAIAGAVALVLIWQGPHWQAITDLVLFAAIASMPLLDPLRRYLLIKSKRFFRRTTGTGQLQSPAAMSLYNCRAGHVLSIVMLLLLIGVLVPMALFRASLGIERRLSIKQAQLHLASALDQRLISIQQMCGKDHLGQYACKKFRDESAWHCRDGRVVQDASTAGNPQIDGPWRQVVLDPMFPDDGTLPVCGHLFGHQATELYSSWFKDLIYTLHHDYNQVSSETLGIIPDRIDFQKGTQENSDSGSSTVAQVHAATIGSDSHPKERKSAGNVAEWVWEDDKSSLTLLWHGIHLPSKSKGEEGQATSKQRPEVTVKNSPAPQPDSESDLIITSSISGSSVIGTFTGLGLAIGVIVAIGILVWMLARRIFLFHIAPLEMTGEMRVAELIREGRNVAVLLPILSDWALDEPKWTLNLREIATGPGWAESLELGKLPANTVIEIAHFERLTDDPELEKEKFILLQRLLAKRNIQIAVIMTAAPSSEDYGRMFRAMEIVDLRDEPFYWLEQYEGPAQSLIWKECSPLTALWPVGAQLAKDIKTEKIHSEDTIASEILERADGYYRLLWKECSEEQKFVLSQVAEDGLLNPMNGRAIRQLVRKGVIKPGPQFRLMNESFRRFVCSAAPAGLKQAWLRESRRSGWGKIHGAFLTTMVLFGVFLLTTQNALWQSAAAYVTTALGALGTVVKMFNSYRGGAAEKAG